VRGFSIFEVGNCLATKEYTAEENNLTRKLEKEKESGVEPGGGPAEGKERDKD